MARDIFHPIDPPTVQAGLPINQHATWHTWSKPFSDFLREASPDLRALGAPPLVRLPGLAQYHMTFSHSSTQWTSVGLQRRFASFAQALHVTRLGPRLILFDRLIGPDLDGTELHALFALFRDALAEFAGDRRAAMYTPLGEVGKGVREFPLHADLYIPQLLFNVFDNVPADESGASLFLSVSTLRELIPGIKTLPPAVGKRILAMFDRDSTADRFEALYDLLHGEHKWVRPLERVMEQQQLRIKLQSGQGYLLNDRTWLHGREAPNGGVPVNRVHRLVFTGAP
jgi:hypothetical protein